MKRLTILAGLIICATVSAAPADLARGKQVAETVCASCHAGDGNSSIPTYPKLSSQHASYIIKQTQDIKTSKRTSGSSAMMAPMVQNLSDEDIANAAAYFAKQAPKAGEADPKLTPAAGAKIYRGGIADKKCLRVCLATAQMVQVRQQAARRLMRIRALAVSTRIMWLRS